MSSFGPTTADRVLVRAVRLHGSDDAFGILYDRHTPRAFQTAWRILGGSQHDAEDAVQEAWLRAVGLLDSWHADDAFGAWFRGIAAHVAIDTLRKHSRLNFEPELEWEGDE